MNENENTKIPINIILICVVLISIYILFKEYIYEKENRSDFILETKDFEDNYEKYNESDIFKSYSNLSEHDRKFLNDYINYTIIKNKDNKPSFYKKIKKIRNQVIFSSMVTFLFASSVKSFLIALRQNSIQHFIISGI